MPNVMQLGYLGFEVSSLEAWRTFAAEVLALPLTAADVRGELRLRMDRHPQRFIITEGPADDLAFIGWQVEDPRALEQLAHRIEAFGVPCTRGDASACAARRVGALLQFRDPSGIPNELFCAPELGPEPKPNPLLVSRFLADDLGLGHIVISADDCARSIAFYRDVLGFRLSDRISCEYYGHAVDITFFHVNRRHHSLAIGQRQKKRLHHFMLEVAALDDVGFGFDRTLRHGLSIMQTLGRHPNDRMVSFYAKTPSGFQFELGYGGREVNDADWQATTYDRISEWGHHPVGVLAAREGKRS